MGKRAPSKLFAHGEPALVELVRGEDIHEARSLDAGVPIDEVAILLKHDVRIEATAELTKTKKKLHLGLYLVGAPVVSISRVDRRKKARAARPLVCPSVPTVTQQNTLEGDPWGSAVCKVSLTAS